MFKSFILFAALLLFTPAASTNGGCCTAYPVVDQYGYNTGYMYIKNHWGRWVNCWTTDGYNYHYNFQMPPQGVSRTYPVGNWGCG